MHHDCSTLRERSLGTTLRNSGGCKRICTPGTNRALCFRARLPDVFLCVLCVEDAASSSSCVFHLGLNNKMPPAGMIATRSGAAHAVDP